MDSFPASVSFEETDKKFKTKMSDSEQTKKAREYVYKQINDALNANPPVPFCLLELDYPKSVRHQIALELMSRDYALYQKEQTQSVLKKLMLLRVDTLDGHPLDKLLVPLTTRFDASAHVWPGTSK